MSSQRTIRALLLLLLYTVLLSGCLWSAYLLRFDFNIGPQYLVRFSVILAGVVGLKLILLLLFGQFASLLTYFSMQDAQKILAATAIAALLILCVWFFGGGVLYAPPRAVVLTDFILSFLALCSLRMGFRMIREGYFATPHTFGASGRKIGLIGAGDVGALLARDFLMRRGLGMKPVVFFDDDPRKWGTTIHGIGVRGAPETLTSYLRHNRIDEIIISMPSASGRRVREIVGLLHQLGLRFEIVPSYEQLFTGKVRVSQIRPIEFQDLLGRKPVDLQTDRIRGLINGRVVMVTGAGGSIGGELCRQIASQAPRELLLIERSEFLLFQIEQELKQLGFGSEIVPLVADILDDVRMRSIFMRFHPSVIFHTAAHKHVPMMELQPAEAFRNNAIGTMQLADLALAHGTECFVLISTDKAINPTSVMGATKRVAELYLQALQRHGGGSTKYMAVRFGNVLGSSGSVIPTFKRQIAEGGPVTVTHPDVTRFFMTVQEAAGLVLQSAAQGGGGEIFILDMGKSVRIVDLARQLIELSGLRPDVDIEIIFNGLRPGEKLFEELNLGSECLIATDHAKIMRFVGEPIPLEVLRQGMSGIRGMAAGMEANLVKLEIQKLIPEYKPYLTVA